MENKTVKAKVIATGEDVIVYSLKKGGYAEYPNCTREFKQNELQFSNIN